MKILLQLAREPVMIGAFIAMALFMVGIYFLGNWLYSVVIPTPGAVRFQTAALVQMDRPPAPAATNHAHYEDFLNTAVDESPHGLGPYPDLPTDWTYPHIWRALENSYYEGFAAIEHELIQRVLVKLWQSGTKVDQGVMGDNGRVYPLYADTMYVQWDERLGADGKPYRVLREVFCLPPLVHHEGTIEKGVIPSGVNVIDQADAGIEPYLFLGLERLDPNWRLTEGAPTDK